MGCGCGKSKKKSSPNHGANGTTKVRTASGQTRTYASRQDAQKYVDNNPGSTIVK